MTERKNIDRLFQEKFKDFEVDPPEQAWENIEAELQKKERKRRVIPLWFRLGGIAAALIIGIFILTWIVGNKNVEVDAVAKGNNADSSKVSPIENPVNGLEVDRNRYAEGAVTDVDPEKDEANEKIVGGRNTNDINKNRSSGVTSVQNTDDEISSQPKTRR
ncbi:MAG TPA: hypothetical protein VGB43_00755, partial [Flavobacterium sp.]